MLKRALLWLGCSGALSLAGCSAVSVVTYPEAQQVAGGSLTTTESLYEKAAHGKVATGFVLHKGDLKVSVARTKGSRNFPMFAGPLVFPVIPVFWVDWFFGPFETSLAVEGRIDWREPHEFDPALFVIVQDGREIKPTKALGWPDRFYLEFPTTNWSFVLKLRGIRNKAGTVELPDLHFHAGSIWDFSFAP